MIRRYFIFVYIAIAIFFWNQDKFVTAYSFPSVLSIKVPFFMRGYCAPDTKGGYRGRICDLLCILFDTYGGNYRFCLEYFENPEDDFYDIMIYMKKKDKDDIVSNKFFYSSILFDTVPLISIRRKKNIFSSDTNAKKIIINDSILVHFALEEENNYIIVSSIEEGLQKLLSLEAEEFLLDPYFFPAQYTDALRFIQEKEDTFYYEKIYKNIEPVYFLFNYHFFWFYKIFGRGLFRVKREGNFFSSLDHNMLL